MRAARSGAPTTRQRATDALNALINAKINNFQAHRTSSDRPLTARLRLLRSECATKEGRSEGQTRSEQAELFSLRPNWRGRRGRWGSKRRYGE